MWLITTFGFFSIVQDNTNGLLAARARTRRDMDALRSRYLPEMGEIAEDGNDDYKYVAQVPREALARAMSEIAMHIDYQDFRDSVLALQGYRRSMLYERIWNILWKLQEEEQWFNI